MATRDYVIRRRPDTTVIAACHEVGCPAWRHGWVTITDERTDLGREQARYIRQSSGRTFTETRDGQGLTVFRFESGQRCFAEHATTPFRFLAGGRPVADLAAWVGDFDDHVNRLEAQAKKG